MPIQGSFHELCFISLSVWVIITKPKFQVFKHYNILIIWNKHIRLSVCLAVGVADFQITLKQLYRRCRVLTCCSEWRPGTLMDIMSTSRAFELLLVVDGIQRLCLNDFLYVLPMFQSNIKDDTKIWYNLPYEQFTHQHSNVSGFFFFWGGVAGRKLSDFLHSLQTMTIY